MASQTTSSSRSCYACVMALGMILVGMTGCSSTYTVKVDAIRTPEAAPRRTYQIVPADAGRSWSDPTFQEAARLVDRALEMNGLFAASRPEWADMIIELDVGIGQRRLVSVPDNEARDSGAVAIYVPDRQGGTLGESTGTYIPTAALTRVISVWECELRTPDHLAARLDVSLGGYVDE